MSKMLYKGAEVGGTVGNGLPCGTIIPFASNATLPNGYLRCEGQAISRTVYADLFSAIGTEYGEGDGSSTFNLPNLLNAALLNGSYDKTEYTTAGTYTFTALKSGFYKITIKGAGAGGQGGSHSDNQVYSNGGHGGGEGGTTFSYEKMTAGDTASIIIGAGGAGGAKVSGTVYYPGTEGADGGDSSVTVNNSTYTAGGGKGDGSGGTGTIQGCAGISGDGMHRTASGSIYSLGGAGGGAGGANSNLSATPNAGIHGGGGAGGTGQYSSGTGGYYDGSAGGDGFVTFEYIGSQQSYIIKAFESVSLDSSIADFTQLANDVANRLTRELTPAFNKRVKITTSGAFTAPVSGWYKFTIKGAGGGGAGSNNLLSIHIASGGAGGGEGGTTFAYEKMTVGDIATITIGAGGAGGAAGASGSTGGDSSIAVNGATYTANGGTCGFTGVNGGYGGKGGDGTIQGICGESGAIFYCASTSIVLYAQGGSGGGNGGGRTGIPGIAGIDGAGGSGGYGGFNKSASTFFENSGFNGGDGYVFIEYFDPTLQ